MSNTSI